MTTHNVQHDLGREQQELDRYLKARMEWDDRYGSARIQALNWRYLSFFLLGLLMLSMLGMVYLGTLPKKAIHVIEVDKLGHAAYQGEAGTSGVQYKVNEASRKYHLTRFIEDVRSLPADPIVVKRQWEDAYALVTPAAANMLSDYARKYVPTDRMKEERITLNNLTLIPISENSWSAEWEETYWNTRGGNNGTHKWKGIFNLTFQEPTTDAQLKVNPIGMYIDSFSWTQAE